VSGVFRTAHILIARVRRNRHGRSAASGLARNTAAF